MHIILKLKQPFHSLIRHHSDTKPYKLMKNKTLKKSIWYYLLGMLGFQSCVSFGGAEYGVPQATFNINGVVNSHKTEQPIADIKVLMQKYHEYSDTSFVASVDSAFTNEKGEFALSFIDFPAEQEYILQFIDVDGEANGSYAAKDTSVVFNDPQYTGGDKSWYSGEVTKSIEVKLSAENEE